MNLSLAAIDSPSDDLDSAEICYYEILTKSEDICATDASAVVFCTDHVRDVNTKSAWSLIQDPRKV